MDINESENEEVEAQNNLGECYYYGRGVEQDYEKAKCGTTRQKKTAKSLTKNYCKK